MTRVRSHVLLLLLSIAGLSAAHSYRAETASRCLFNGRERRCRIEINGDNLLLDLGVDGIITIDQRGRCANRQDDGETVRTCNVRIGLPDDFVFGLIVRNNQTGATITSPRFEIRLPDLLQ